MFWKKAVAMRTGKEYIYQNKKEQRSIAWWVKDDTPVFALETRMDGAPLSSKELEREENKWNLSSIANKIENMDSEVFLLGVGVKQTQ